MGITVDVKASLDKSRTEAVLHGSVIEIISDEEREAFSLSDRSLKNAVGKFCGKEPGDVFVKSPTPWGDLYNTYRWQQVRKILKPVSARVLGVRTEPVIVATKEFANNSSVDVTYNSGINHSISNTVSSTWSKQHNVSVGQTVSYKVDFLVAGVEGETSFSYTHTWGEEYSKSQQITLGSQLGVEVLLKPGQSVTSSLSANRGTMEVEVLYAATVHGIVASNYPDTFNGHHFWGYDVNEVLEAAALPTTLEMKEVLKIGFYSDGKVTVSDNKSSMRLAAEPAIIRT